VACLLAAGLLPPPAQAAQIVVELADVPLAAVLHQRLSDAPNDYVDQITVFAPGQDLAGGDTVQLSFSLASPLTIRIDPLAQDLTLSIWFAAADPGAGQQTLTLSDQPLWTLLSPQNIGNDDATAQARTITASGSGDLGYVIGDNNLGDAPDFLTNAGNPGFFTGFQGTFSVPGDLYERLGPGATIPAWRAPPPLARVGPAPMR
jgi:hypothetical protein